MKKILISLSCSLVLASLASCSNETPLLNTIAPVEVQNTQTFAAKQKIDTLIKKMVDKRFTFADKNKDKKLAFSEFKGLESEHEDVMQEIFNEVDTNKDKIVTYEEFLKSDTSKIKNTLDQMFSMIDRNGNDFIDQGFELSMLVEVAHGMATDSGNKVTQADVEKDYLSYDANKDGKLSLEEYQSPEMKYILMAPVDPYKNSAKSVGNPVSLNKLVNNLKAKIKK